MINEVINEKLFEISPDDTRISIYKNVFTIPVYLLNNSKNSVITTIIKTINNLT